MRTNIEIDDALMEQALRAGPFKTKKDAVEAGLRLLARQSAYREILKWRGKLQWEGDEAHDWPAADAADAAAVADAADPNSPGSALLAQDAGPASPYRAGRAKPRGSAASSAESPPRKRHAGR